MPATPGTPRAPIGSTTRASRWYRFVRWRDRVVRGDTPARQLRPALEAINMKMQAKRPNWETLNQLNEFQAAILDRIEPGIIERMLEGARFDDVSGSEDFKAFTADIGRA